MAYNSEETSVEKLQAENKRLREYAQHLPDCPKDLQPFRGICDCGLEQALKGE